jgi:dTDP-4-dehydrorhamnose reductase
VQTVDSWSILRTVLVIGIAEDLSRSNIVLWAKGALEKAQPIRVVDDQFRTPTLAEDLAQGALWQRLKGHKEYLIFPAQTSCQSMNW